MKILSALLFPFSILYQVITDIRNRLYDQGLKPVATFEVPIVSVGNLTVGGTGKTPMIEHLVRLLFRRYKVATLSRGYGRKTKGIRIAGERDDAFTIGDEPYQLYSKFSADIRVVVGEERALAIPYLLDEHPDTEVILMDDAFQHRRVKPAFQVLLTEHSRLFYKDLLLPAGRLRESKKGTRRADAVVVTKCPAEISDDEMMEIEAGIKVYAKKPVFFSTIRYNEIVPLGRAAEAQDNVILVSGIASSRSFHDHMAASYRLVRHFNFSDHHNYTVDEVRKICDAARKHRAMVITTEKDAVKLKSEPFRSFVDGTPFFYQPVEMEFLKNGEDFDEMVINAVKNA